MEFHFYIGERSIHPKKGKVEKRARITLHDVPSTTNADGKDK